MVVASNFQKEVNQHNKVHFYLDVNTLRVSSVNFSSLQVIK